MLTYRERETGHLFVGVKGRYRRRVSEPDPIFLGGVVPWRVFRTKPPLSTDGGPKGRFWEGWADLVAGGGGGGGQFAFDASGHVELKRLCTVTVLQEVLGEKQAYVVTLQETRITSDATVSLSLRDAMPHLRLRQDRTGLTAASYGSGVHHASKSIGAWT